MKSKAKPPFDKAFLAKAMGGGPSPNIDADSVFYIHDGKVKVTVISEQGKEAVVAVLGSDEFCGCTRSQYSVICHHVNPFRRQASHEYTGATEHSAT